ncbi:MAG: hypothetical protein ACM32E_06985 [Gemmatimonadota bacterium]
MPASAAGTAAATRVAAAAGKSVKPNKLGELDCNGWSPIQQPVRRTMACTDPHGSAATGGRFYDNGWYIGHDEPDLRFVSPQPGSGNDVTWNETLGADPAAAPTTGSPGSDVTHYLELSAAPWFSMTMCDPQSYPQNPCTPQSDSNAPAVSCISVTSTPCTQAAAGAGAAFMELQFYPPGSAPFADSISCDNTHWCGALTIDSLECSLNFANCNPNCIEPVNFAFLQTNGVPAGPPSPQLADLQTVTPNAHTLLMNPGDRIRVHMFDAPASGGGSAFEAVVKDLSTGQTGFMQASAANGFMNTDVSTCAGTPFSFQPEFSTAAPGNMAAWTALQVNISTQFEIGHFEPCSQISAPATLALGGGVTDTYWKRCAGAYESATSPDGGSKTEVNSAPCYPQGDTHGGLAAPDIVTGCDVFFQGGDVDFDGTPYWADWPTSTTPNRFPSTFAQHAPTTVGGANYQQFQFQTDVALSELTCSGSGSGCAVPPPAAPGAFYPYWTRSSACTWEFGNMPNGSTYGKQAQYGTNGFATLGYSEFESGLFANTCT